MDKKGSYGMITELMKETEEEQKIISKIKAKFKLCARE